MARRIARARAPRRSAARISAPRWIGLANGGFGWAVQPAYPTNPAGRRIPAAGFVSDSCVFRRRRSRGPSSDTGEVAGIGGGGGGGVTAHPASLKMLAATSERVALGEPSASTDTTTCAARARKPRRIGARWGRRGWGGRARRPRRAPLAGSAAGHGVGGAMCGLPPPARRGGCAVEGVQRGLMSGRRVLAVFVRIVVRRGRGGDASQNFTRSFRGGRCEQENMHRC